MRDAPVAVTPLPSPPVGRRAAIVAAILYVGFSLLIQVENFALFTHAPADGWRSVFVFAAQLPFRQVEHILFGVALASLVIPMCRWRMGRIAYVAAFGLLLLYLVVDQIAFPAFGGHFELSWSVGGVSLRDARDSILAEIPTTFVPNVVVWAGVVAMMARAVRNRPMPAFLVPRLSRRRARKPGAVAAGLLVFTAASLTLMATTPASPNDREAILVLIRSAMHGDPDPGGQVVADPGLYRLRFGTAVAGTEVQALPGMFNEIRRAAPRPNIVLVMMESVGSQQLFGEGGLSPRITPTLAALADRSVSFEALYSTFPGSMRGQLPINTGGRTVTWNNFDGAVVDRYQGPVLVRQLQKIGYRTAFASAQSLELENCGRF